LRGRPSAPITIASSSSRRSGRSRTTTKTISAPAKPLKTDDDLKAVAARYLFRAKGNWFIGAQGNAANYQVLGATAEDDLVLETLGVRGFNSAAVGAVVMHDSRDNEDMPTTGLFLNINNLAYREALGGSSSFDAYRVDIRTFWKHGGGHVLAV
jgi:hypothetical protein